MSADATLPLRPGEWVAGRYEVDRVLGVGGMGAVFAARDGESGELVALKCLLPEFCSNADVVTRFQREGRATARLLSEHVTRVYDSGVIEPNPSIGAASGVPYIVMEYLEGRDLRSLVKNGGPLSAKDAAGFVIQACDALAEAHALGIIHRDLKPANLFLTRRPNGAALVKVLDFGIAKFQSANLAGDHHEMTRTRAVLGSRAYMSPEQMLRPKDVDARADIWSLGIILYFLVTGKNPFSAETTEALILKVVQDEPAPLSAHRADLPPGFEAVVLRCLAKARENRFPNVTELARALAPFARNAPDRRTLPMSAVGTPLPLPEAAPSMRAYAVTRPQQDSTSVSQHDTASRTSVTQSAPRRGHPAIIVLSAAAVVAVAAGLALLRQPLKSVAEAAPVRPAIAAAANPAPAPEAPAAAPTAEPAAPIASASAAPTATPAPTASAEVAVASAPRPESTARRAAVPAAPKPPPKPVIKKASASDSPW